MLTVWLGIVVYLSGYCNNLTLMFAIMFLKEKWLRVQRLKCTDALFCPVERQHTLAALVSEMIKSNSPLDLRYILFTLTPTCYQFRAKNHEMSQLSIIQVRQTHFCDGIDYYYWPIRHLRQCNATLQTLQVSRVRQRAEQSKILGLRCNITPSAFPLGGILSSHIYYPLHLTAQ